MILGKACIVIPQKPTPAAGGFLGYRKFPGDSKQRYGLVFLFNLPIYDQKVLIDKQALESHSIERKTTVLSNTDHKDLAQLESPPTAPKTLLERRGPDTLFAKQSHWLYFPDFKLVDKTVSIFDDQQWFLGVSWKLQKETAWLTGRLSWSQCICFAYLESFRLESQKPWLVEQNLGQSVCCSSRCWNRSKGASHEKFAPASACVRPGCCGLLSGRQVSQQVPPILYKDVNSLPITLLNISLDLTSQAGICRRAWGRSSTSQYFLKYRGGRQYFWGLLKGVATETIHSPVIFKASQDGNNQQRVEGIIPNALPNPLPSLFCAFAQSTNMGNEPVKLTCVPSIERTPFLPSDAVFFMRTPGNNFCLASVWTS